MVVSRAVTLTDGPTCEDHQGGGKGLKVARMYCTCMVGPLHQVHVAGSQGQECSPESRQQVFFLYFTSVLFSPVLLLPSSVPFPSVNSNMLQQVTLLYFTSVRAQGVARPCTPG